MRFDSMPRNPNRRSPVRRLAPMRAILSACFTLSLRIAGRKLEVIYEDHAADASKAVNAMRRLVEVEKVPFSLTSYSAPTLAIQPIAAQNKAVIMNGGGQSDNLANKDYLYNKIPVV